MIVGRDRRHQDCGRSIVVDTFAADKMFNINKQILILDRMEHSDNQIKK